MTDVPAQTGFIDGEMVTDTGNNGFTVTGRTVAEDAVQPFAFV